MKFSEFSEGKLGAQTVTRRITAPNVTTIDNTAPWTRAQQAKAYKRTVDFNALKTDKEKFDFLYNLKTGKTNNRILIQGGLQIKAYDPVTGEIELVSKKGDQESTLKGNVNNFTFQGRSRVVSGNIKNYNFIPSNLSIIDTVATKRGRPAGRPAKKEYNFPKLPW